MGAGAPLQEPLLPAGGGASGGASAAPSAPPLVHNSSSGVTYAPAMAPPGVNYPPAYEQQHGSYPPAVMGTPAAAPRGALAPPPAGGPVYAPPTVVTHTTVYERPAIQRVTLVPVLQACPACGHTGPTRVRRERGCCTWLQCFAMSWIFCPLFWLPCCLDCSKDLVHRCGHCNAEVARIAPC